MQIWPEFIIPPQAAALAARSRSASARTIIGSLPPSSRLTGVSVSAARAITLRPVRSEPVNWMKSTSSTRAPPVSPTPWTQSKTSGPPISCFQASITSVRPSGVNSEGLMTTAQQACRAGIESPSERISGKFQGLMIPTTGWGRYWILSFLGASRGGWCGFGTVVLWGGGQGGVGADALLADEARGAGAVEVDQVGEVAGLVAGVGADLAGLRLHRVEHPLLVVEQPVAQLAEPAVATLDPHRLPLALVGADPLHGRGDGLGRGDRDFLDQPTRRRV